MVSARALSYESPTLPDRGFDACLGQALGVADRHVLHPAVAMVDQAAPAERLARVQSLLQGIQHEVGAGIERDTFQPTIYRANTSMTKAT
jgi:hypothetical protein